MRVEMAFALTEGNHDVPFDLRTTVVRTLGTLARASLWQALSCAAAES
jgi:hypothetical protein